MIYQKQKWKQQSNDIMLGMVFASATDLWEKARRRSMLLIMEYGRPVAAGFVSIMGTFSFQPKFKIHTILLIL